MSDIGSAVKCGTGPPLVVTYTCMRIAPTQLLISEESNANRRFQAFQHFV